MNQLRQWNPFYSAYAILCQLATVFCKDRNPTRRWWVYNMTVLCFATDESDVVHAVAWDGWVDNMIVICFATDESVVVHVGAWDGWTGQVRDAGRSRPRHLGSHGSGDTPFPTLVLYLRW